MTHFLVAVCVCSYWNTHPWQRAKRDMAEIVKDILAAGRGGARLRKEQMEALDLDESLEEDVEEETEEGEEREGTANGRRGEEDEEEETSEAGGKDSVPPSRGTTASSNNR
jgi:predicted transposase YdaD